MRVLVIGGGGREHALCRAIAASRRCSDLLCAPGNDGIAADPHARTRCHRVAVGDIDGLVALAKAEAVDLVVVGPEAPLVDGLVDRLAQIGIAAFGPTAAAARIEASKAHMKSVCAQAGVKTAPYAVFDAARIGAAIDHVRAKGAPIVVKDDGLAAGKGVVVAATIAEAEAAVRAFLDGPTSRIVIEEALPGEEASVFAFVDGRTVIAFGSARDHKRAFDGDQGPNTGGMGAVSPHPSLDPDEEAHIIDAIIRPVAMSLDAMGTPYRGVLFAGIMMVPGAGGRIAHVLEFNARFGDPECQTLLARLDGDLLPTLDAVARHRLSDLPDAERPRLADHAAVTVVLASNGYPTAPVTGSDLGDLSSAERLPDVRVLHAATKRQGDRWLAAGGRVLNVTATGPSIPAARTAAYAAIDRIRWPGGFCRRDIATAEGDAVIRPSLDAI